MQEKSRMENLAYEYHCSGFHCAEAVLKAAADCRFGASAGPGLPMAATAFGGGMGRTFKETCGALTGGLIAIGLLFGRNAANADWSEAAELGAGLRERFIGEFGTTNCGVLLEKFGPKVASARCREVSGRTAGMLDAILSEHGQGESVKESAAGGA